MTDRSRCGDLLERPSKKKKALSGLWKIGCSSEKEEGSSLEEADAAVHEREEDGLSLPPPMPATKNIDFGCDLHPCNSI